MTEYKVSVQGKEYLVTLQNRHGNSLTYMVGSESYTVEVEPQLRPLAGAQSPAPVGPMASAQTTNRQSSNEITAPMPGLIVSIAVKSGDAVTAGQTVVVMEAMKMENNITATSAGTVKTVHVKPGVEVGNHQILVTLE